MDKKEATGWTKEVKNGNPFAKQSGREVFQGFLNEKVLVLFLRKSGGVAIDTSQFRRTIGPNGKNPPKIRLRKNREITVFKYTYDH